MSDRITMLMLKALRRLDPDEQDEVLESLLAARLGADAPPPLGVPGAATPLPEPPEADRTARVVRLFGVDPAGLTGVQGRLKVLPVRLPAADYDQLREWSRQQGFSMAVVIRTLLERFLDEQRSRPSPNLGTDDP